MSEGITLSGPELLPRAGNAQQLVILLHGLGSDGNDLIGLAPYWAPLLPRAAFVSPNAPFPCDMAPYGYQWFSLQDRSMGSMLAGVKAAAPILDAFIDAQLTRFGLSDDKLALVGFSQGTMMSLYVAPRRARAAACVLGYSGALVGAEALKAECRSKPRFLLVHGDADPVVPAAAMPAAAASLRAMTIPVETLSRPGLGHSIDQEGLSRGGQFLKAALG